MSSDTHFAMLDEVISPHLATNEGQDFLAGQARLDEVRVSLSPVAITFLYACSRCTYHPSFVQTTLVEHSPAAASHLKELILQFMWEQISIVDIQKELQQLYATEQCLKEHTSLAQIQPFLKVDTTAEEGRAAAKEQLCRLFGLVTQKGNPDSQRKMEEATKFHLDVQERFRDQPGNYDRFLHTGLGVWRLGEQKEEVRSALIKMLETEEDLLQRFEAIWPGASEAAGGQ